MTGRIIPYLCLTYFCIATTSAQEVVTGLRSDILIANSAREKTKGASFLLADPVELPFFDDFSRISVFPDQARWTDDYVFINNTYSDKQITSGVATFDALDNVGRLYESASQFTFIADLLTSQPVNLNYSASENIWFSFFYQAGGLGDSPEQDDSLTLQFYAPEESKWYSVWKAEGRADQEFRAVILNITEDRFLKNGFQFRFANYATLSANMSDQSMIGNCDHWNIDYVLLDRNRNAGDTIFNDVAMRLPVRSLLKTHEAMPWKQYREIELQEMGSSILIHYRNNDTITRNVTRNFVIRDVYSGTISHIFSSGASNIDPLTNVDYDANLIYSFSSTGTDSALFRITAILKTDEFDPKENDTMVYDQVFRNYFAFDDGTSEAGYGINGLGSRNAMFAYRFRSYTDDTLRAVTICFNDSYSNANKRSFDLMVWDDNNGQPGNVLYTAEEVMVEQAGSMNGFYTYKITDKVPVRELFYIGWRQRSESFLNAGLDVNTPHRERQLYWLNGEWLPSQVNGSVMIRPVVGDALKITSSDDNGVETKSGIRIWPNPASEHIDIDNGEMGTVGDTYVTILDLNGREVIKTMMTGRVDIGSLPSGIYILITTRGGIPTGYGRFVKTK